MTSIEILEVPDQMIRGDEYDVSFNVKLDAFGLITNNSIFFEDKAFRTTYMIVYKELRLNNIFDGMYTINKQIKKEHTLSLESIDIRMGIGVSNGLFISEKEIKWYEYQFDGSKYVIKQKQ